MVTLQDHICIYDSWTFCNLIFGNNPGNPFAHHHLFIFHPMTYRHNPLIRPGDWVEVGEHSFCCRLTSSRRITSSWSRFWNSSHSSLYRSISSLVWRIFFLSTSSSGLPCGIVVVMLTKYRTSLPYTPKKQANKRPRTLHVTTTERTGATTLKISGRDHDWTEER